MFTSCGSTINLRQNRPVCCSFFCADFFLWTRCWWPAAYPTRVSVPSNTETYLSRFPKWKTQLMKSNFYLCRAMSRGYLRTDIGGITCLVGGVHMVGYWLYPYILRGIWAEPTGGKVEMMSWALIGCYSQQGRSFRQSVLINPPIMFYILAFYGRGKCLLFVFCYFWYQFGSALAVNPTFYPIQSFKVIQGHALNCAEKLEGNGS